MCHVFMYDMYICMYVRMYVRIFLCMYVCTYVRVYVDVNLLRKYVSMYAPIRGFMSRVPGGGLRV